MSEREQAAAEELDALMGALLEGEELPQLPSLPLEDVAFTARLVVLARTTEPDPTFAADLEANLRTRAAARPVKHLARRPWSAPARRVVFWACVVLLLLAGLLAVPPLRAAMLDVLRIGAVRIFQRVPTVAPVLVQTATPRSLATPVATMRPSPVPSATSTPLVSVLDLAGETTLAEAQKRTGFPIRLPTYPADLGSPDRVFLQDLGGPVVVLVWLAPGEPETVRMSLHILGSNTFAGKVQPPTVSETTVHGQQAVWTEGPYLLQYRSNEYDARRLVTGHVLVWTEGELTYRLETSLSLEEAVRVAESIP